MAREFARVRLSIWEDDEFRALDADPQHLYLVLLTSSKLDYCGVTDWREKRIAQLVSDWTTERVEAAGMVLAGQLYIAIDEDTEEVLLRSFIRNDELLDSPNMAVAMRKAHTAVASSSLRAIVVHELRRLRVDKPDLRGWDRVADMLEKTAMDPSEYALSKGLSNPSGKGSGNPSGKGSSNPSISPTPTPSPKGSGKGSPTTATTTATATAPPSTTSSGGDRRKRRTALPDDWKPSAKDVEWQRGEGISDVVARRELPKFCDHWRGNDERKADWSATWRNWLRRTMEREPGGGQGVNGHEPGWAFS